MTDHEFREELERRIKALRAVRKEYDEAQVQERAADEAQTAARTRRRDLWKKVSIAASVVHELSWGNEEMVPEFKE